LGDKTSMLEMVGLLLLILMGPSLLAGKHVIFNVDNIIC